MHLRPATEADAAALLDIYAHYVRHTAITFEWEVPTLDDFAQRIRSITAHYPYLVAEHDGVPVGYAYASTFKGRAAYDWCVETSIYVHHQHIGEGLGRLLLDGLEDELRRRGFLNVYACIATTPVDDEYLTNHSVHCHRHMGYRLCGEFLQCGYKFGRWYNMVWMEKMLGEHDDSATLSSPLRG